MLKDRSETRVRMAIAGLIWLICNRQFVHNCPRVPVAPRDVTVFDISRCTCGGFRERCKHRARISSNPDVIRILAFTFFPGDE